MEDWLIQGEGIERLVSNMIIKYMFNVIAC